MARQRTANGRRGWRQWTEQEARDALAELESSGEGIARFARSKGISEQRLYYWRKRISEAGAQAPAFVAVPVAPSLAQIEIASDAVTVRVREGLDLDQVGHLIEVVARRGRGC